MQLNIRKWASGKVNSYIYVTTS